MNINHLIYLFKNRHQFSAPVIQSQPADPVQVLYPDRIPVSQVRQNTLNDIILWKNIILVFSRHLARGTDKLKELSRQPVVVERVEQLLGADSDPRVQQVWTPSLATGFDHRPSQSITFLSTIVLLFFLNL